MGAPLLQSKEGIMKKIIVSVSIAVLVLICGFLTFLLVTAPKDKVFEKRGVTVQLESDFKVIDTEKWDFYAENSKYAFMSNRIGKKSNITTPDGKTTLELTNFTLSSYLSLILATYGMSSDPNQPNYTTVYYVDTYGSAFYYCYYKDANDKYGYMLMVKESLNYFYTINIFTIIIFITMLRV